MGGDESPELPPIRHGTAGFVAVKAPQADQPAYGGIEELVRLRGETLRTADERGDLRRCADVPIPAGDRLVEGDQVARFPCVQFAMHAVELAEHARDRGPGPCRFYVQHRDLRDRS